MVRLKKASYTAGYTDDSTLIQGIGHNRKLTHLFIFMKKILAINLLIIIFFSYFIFAKLALAQSTTNCTNPGETCKPLACGDGETERQAPAPDCTSPQKCCVAIQSTQPPATPTTPAVGGTTSLEEVNPLKGVLPENTTPEVGVQIILGNAIKAILGVVGSFALIMFVYGGFLMLVSHGNAELVKKGKEVLIWAVIGIIVIFGSYAIVNFVITGIQGGGGGGGTSTSSPTPPTGAGSTGVTPPEELQACPENSQGVCRVIDQCPQDKVLTQGGGCNIDEVCCSI